MLNGCRSTKIYCRLNCPPGRRTKPANRVEFASEVEAQAAGFQTSVRQGIQLTVGREIEIEMLLRLGQVEQVTEVTAEAPLVETVTNTLSGLVDEQK